MMNHSESILFGGGVMFLFFARRGQTFVYFQNKQIFDKFTNFSINYSTYFLLASDSSLLFYLSFKTQNKTIPEAQPI